MEKTNLQVCSKIPLSAILDYVEYLIEKSESREELLKLFNVFEYGTHHHYESHKEFYRLHGCFDSTVKNFPRGWFNVIQFHSNNYAQITRENYDWRKLFHYGMHVAFESFRKNVKNIKSKEFCDCILKIALNREKIYWREIEYQEIDQIDVEIDVYYD